ncbi:hypothetical protein PMM47T1_13895 [Pseudomonas sp. M47T1]|uniref:hypothetical protein n=1 Tax=Pseudomonas sp. M47T1 TaxID=1179778 RepID=UPI00026085EE|nr:hypothetical protein [Pseudomonas sp. M47T1]EIK96057.1 hypothetical protein PMM47T1_13895 [Pseudomonas sp. M47T1]
MKPEDQNTDLNEQQIEDNGDDFVPTDDDATLESIGEAGKGEGEGGSEANADAGADAGGADQGLDAETLAAIAGEDKPKMVPHSRFQEKNDEAKAHRARVLELEEELARVKGSAPAAKPKEEPVPVEYDYDAAEDRYNAAILDGDSTLAKQIRAEIRKAERVEAEAKAEAAADRRYKANKERDDLARANGERDLAIAKAYEAYPFLDSAGSEPNQDAIEEVLALANFYTGKGKSVGDSITAAVAKVGPRYAPVQAEATPAKVDAAPKADLQKGIERAAKIPAKPEGIGARAAKLDVSKMTSKELKALSPEDEARLAGDIL